MSGQTWQDRLRDAATRCSFHPDVAEDILAVAREMDEEDARPVARGLAHRNGKRTEAAAAAARLPGWETQCALILRHMVQVGGFTHDELEVAAPSIGVKTNAHRTRVRNLVTSGLAMDSERTRPSRTGTDSVVWIATPRGRRYVEDGWRRRGEM